MYMVSCGTGGLWSQVTNSWHFACICGRHLQRWLLQLLFLKCRRLAFALLFIASLMSLLWCRPGVSMAVVLIGCCFAFSYIWFVACSLGRHRSSDVTDAISRETRVNLWHLRSNSWSSYLWRCLPQMQAKRQEFVTWDHGPNAWKILYTWMSVVKA